MQGTAKGLELTNKGRQKVMATTADLTNRVVQKEIVRKVGVGARHKMHVLIDDLVQIFYSLPLGWRIVWAVGAIVLLTLGLTILLVIPFSFTVLIALWTFLIVKLAGITSTDEDPDADFVDSSGFKRFENPMAGLSIDAETSPASTPSTSPSKGNADRQDGFEEEVIDFTARSDDE